MNSVTCAHCGHVWEIPSAKDYRLTLRAVGVNKDGPFCGLCRTLEEARRFAARRKLGEVKKQITHLIYTLKKL